MARLSRQQWQALIVEFENSGQTQTEFCKQRDINPKYFSLLYSLIETAKANDLNVYDYLSRVFTDLPNANGLDDIEALLPWNVALA